ncbi:MAG TPA: sigma 54-interacting transcriptional regulator [Pirellulales bacterium]|nr:sigma 54-interacting transcriptional regulator [Pirellulales bacterium]
MPRPRTTAQQLVRHFAAAARPVYLIDDRHEIVYCNAACAAWAGVSEEQLVGQTCRYGPTADDRAAAATLVGPAAAAARLCPPPTALAGSAGRGWVSAIDLRGELVFRQADFLPLSPGAPAAELSGEGSTLAGADLLSAAVASAPAGLLVVVDAVDASAPVDSEPADGASAESLHAALASWRHRLAGRYRLERMVGSSAAATRVRSQVSLAAAAPANVLVVGPPGAGKEHVARAIHYRSPADSTGQLVPVACGSIDAEQLIATLGGLARTPPTEAWRTLLLLGVDRLSLEAQAAVSMFAGSLASWRVVATAERPPAELVAAGTLRSDLTAWLSTLTIELPPLAQRLEDLPLLAQLYLEETNATARRQLAGFTPEALDALAAYSWPGNLDELATVVREAHDRAADLHVGPRDLPRQIHLAADAAGRPQRRDEPVDLAGLLAKIEIEIIERALARAKGNKSRAAHLLGLTRPRLYRRLVQLGLEEDREKFRPQP